MGTLADLVHGRGMRALLLHGPRGSGKSTFVTQVRDQWLHQGGVVAYQGLPPARVEDDWNQVEVESAVRQVIARLAWDLRVDCRRLVASKVAMGLTLPSADRAAARQAMLAEWLKYRRISNRWKKLGDMAGRMVEQVAGQQVLPVLGKGTLQGVVSDTVSWTLHSVARRALPPTLRWFADPYVLQTRGKDEKAALDALCDLSINAAAVDDIRAAREVTRIQLLALLADLATVWSSGTARHRTDRAVVLLDDVDTPVGHRFVTVWNDAWTTLQARGQAGEVPLFLVATSAVPVLRDGTGRDSSSWQVARLPDLTRDEVQLRARQRLGGEFGELVGAIVHEITDGHRGSTETLLDPWLWAPLNYQPADVLGFHLDGVNVEDRLLEGLLDPDIGPKVTELLCCCAVAHYQAVTGALLLAVVSTHDPVCEQVRPRLNTLSLWTESDDRPTLLRRLLLRRLAREKGHGETWTQLHQRLIGSGVDRAYYLMGLEKPRAAAEQLVNELFGTGPGTPSVTKWVGQIRSVAAAPRATFLPGSSAAEQADVLRRLVTAGDKTEPGEGQEQEQVPADPSQHRSRAVSEATYDLLILLAVASDPFRAVPRSQLHRQIAACYGELERALWEAGHHDNDGALPLEIQTHMALDTCWRQLERTVPRPPGGPQIT
jgi:hypothetical protein